MQHSNNRVELEVSQRAFSGRIHTFAIVNKEHVDIKAFFADAYRFYESELTRTIEQFEMVKTRSVFLVEFKKAKTTTTTTESSNSDEISNENRNSTDDQDDDNFIKETFYAPTSNQLIGLETNLSEHYKRNVVEEATAALERAEFCGSGYTFSRIIRLDVEVCSYRPLGGSSYIATPCAIRRKRAVINVRNGQDQMCFKWAILSALHPKNHMPDRLDNYLEYSDELNFDGIEFPVSLNRIEKFEKQNSNISVNVYYYDYYDDYDKDNEDDECVRPLRITGEIKEHHIHLLLILEKARRIQVKGGRAGTIAGKIKAILNDGSIRSHYCWIQDLSRLLSSQLTKGKRKMYICDRCLNYFDKSEKLAKHVEHCTNECKIEMPTEKTKWVKFENYKHQLKVPFVVYADTEAYLKRLNVEEQNCVFSEQCKTTAYQQHHIYSVGLYLKCEYDDALSYYINSGNDVNCVEWFVLALGGIAQFIAREFSNILPMNTLTPAEEFLLKDPNAVCSICDKMFDPLEVRVRDHCHLSGKFRGIAHPICNINYKVSTVVPVVMHNLSRYDAHLFIKKLAARIRGDISIIPHNSEEYISFTKVVMDSTYGRFGYQQKIKLKFIDSFRFMADSLSNLAFLLPSNKKYILHDEGRKSNYTKKQIKMLQRKGVFPYDHVDSLERLNETSVPSRECFKNELNETKISLKEYKFACKVWKEFGIKTLGEYSLLYLKTDVLLLADIFENFRNTCHSIYKMDPAHYVTAPGLSYDAMLKYTGVEIELFTDIEMLLFIERGIRGGISQCSKRYVKANNEYMDDVYKPDEETSCIMYLDGEIFFFFFLTPPFSPSFLLILLRFVLSEQLVWTCNVAASAN